MNQTATLEATATMTDTTTAACIAASHHWRIEDPDGLMSRGYCRNCGQEREFRNWLEETDFTTRVEFEFAA